MLEGPFILGQRGGFDPGDFMYLLILGLSMLGGFGKWIRDRSRRKAEEAKATDPVKKPPGRPAASGAARHGAPSARPVPDGRAPAPTATPTTRGVAEAHQAPEPHPEEIVAEFLRTLTTGRRKAAPAPPRPVARPARPARRAGAKHPARAVRSSPPADRAQRAKQRSAKQEVLALEAVMRRKEGAAPELHRPVMPREWTSLSIAELRRAIVLKEVLGPPIALRDEPHLL